MKTIYTFYITIIALSIFMSCDNLVEGINNNPNRFTIDEIAPGKLLNGAEYNSIDLLLGTTSRMAGYYSGQLIGFDQTQLEYYNYNVTSSTFNWDGYRRIITPLREIRNRIPESNLYQGITRVLESQLVGNYASLYGDIPYSEAMQEIKNPKFDNQAAVFEALQLLLDQAVDHLSKVTPQDLVLEDFLFDGNATKWLQSAWTLKARFYMHTKQYSLAYTAALNGVSSNTNSMKFYPLDIEDVTTTKNKFWRLLNGTPSAGTGNSFLISLLDLNSTVSRNHNKTDESARLQYYTIDESDADGNMGIAHETEPQPLITYQENTLILAEAGARTQGFSIGLDHLNSLRAVLATGILFNKSVSAFSRVYEPYVKEDFDAGGLENLDGISPLRALLREIIEERYVSGFTMFMPFDDARRLRLESDLLVPFPNNTPTVSGRVERFLYPEDETLTNTNAPKNLGLFTPNPINQ